MCSETALRFVLSALSERDVRGRAVIEVGSYDVNGSARHGVTALAPASYVGVDLVAGPGVDQICRAERLLDMFEPGSFDVVISTEMVEHVRDWRTVFHNLKALARPGGVVVVTTRSVGFDYHGWPNDFWRWSVDDMRLSFADFDDVTVEDDPDPGAPGVFAVGRKPDPFDEVDLGNLALYSVVRNERCLAVSDLDVQLSRLRQRPLVRSIVTRIPKGGRQGIRRVVPFLASPDAGVVVGGGRRP